MSIKIELPDGQEIYRHSVAHIMALAVLRLYPEVKFGIGPAIEDGFYYDFDLGAIALTTDDLEKIEQQMSKIIECNLEFVREKLPKEEAIKLFKSLNQPYKVELIKEIEEDKVSIYRLGDFVDLCRGPHILSTGKIQAFKLMSVAGAYWRGNEKRPMLQRIYGTAFDSKKGLDDYFARIEEATRRDHRKLGKELELFSISEEFGAGLVLWHPKGALIRKIIEDF
ncbi:MAG: threonine--tRNA ligase, partial [Candidatus Subteraquimicrobiales bacterium]|nr:threonine--tRNA ligase [Candidatus Subteraquimicrobiales bacterium]